MHIILLSGGSGKRLWPLSNSARSKQFLKVLPQPNGDYESMAQRVWRQITDVGIAQSTVIATSSNQVDMIHSQLGESVNLVIEPERRDTFPAIALACAYLKHEKKCSSDDVVVVIPVDPFVEASFFETFAKLEKVLNSGCADIALIGVPPTYPSEKYGYIIPTATDGTESQVKRFKEKPTEAEAKDLMDSGAFWNCGVFAFKLGYVMDIAHKNVPFESFIELRSAYSQLKKISFDYEVVEKAENITVVPYDGFWKDLGTWNTLSEHMGKNIMGNVSMTESCDNTHVVNELDIPVVVMGINNAIVAVSNDGILISDKFESGKLKDVVASMEQRPMFEERRWGWYKVLDYASYKDGKNALTKRLMLKAGKNLSYQLHHQRHEVWTIITGKGELILDDQLMPVKAGDVFSIPAGMKHSLKANEDIELIEVQSGDDLIEEDIERLAHDWIKILNHIK